MGIEVRQISPDESTEDVARKKRKIFIFKWNNILPNKCNLISEKIFFYLDFDIIYKNLNKNNNKIILLGEYNDRFWFFKIIKAAHKHSHLFTATKPLMDNIDNLKIYFIDWYNIIKKFDPKRIKIEYAVFKEE